jgi:uroporphyrin-III C-methyltransferase/precorrin-2 dehydrogenase/sirohydrochlorin ferrochelatase
MTHGAGRLEVCVQDPLTADLSGVLAVVSAIESPLDRQVAARAIAAGIPVNVLDRAELSSFIVPAIVDRGEVVVAIGTGGASPVPAHRLRERIEEILPARIGELAALPVIGEVVRCSSPWQAAERAALVARMGQAA